MSDEQRVRALLGRILPKLQDRFEQADRFRQPAADQIVLVDMSIDLMQGYFMQPLLGKLMCWHTNATMCGILPSLQQAPPAARAVYNAFGCKVFTGLTDVLHKVRAEAGEMRTVVQGLLKDCPTEGDGLRRGLVNLTFDGLPVGDLIYDTHLRQTGRPTIEQLDNRLVRHVWEAWLHYKAAERFLAIGKVQGVVTMHMVYIHLGILSRLALARGIPVIQSLSLNPFRVKRFENFLAARQSPGQFSANEFEHVFRNERETAVAFGRQYLEKRLAGKAELGFRDGIEGAYGAARKRYAKEELCKTLNWDAEKPIVVIMCHVFNESPHAVGGNLYEDYFVWLRETLEIAARNPQVQWLLKNHPQQKYFDELTRSSPHLVPEAQTLAMLLEPVREVGHVALCPEDIHTASLIPFVHAIVTQHGRAGYEFAACGVPVVITATAAYARLGFTVEPRSREAYARVLSSIETLEPLSEEQRERAFTYIYLFFEKSRALCSFMPEVENRGAWGPPYDVSLLEGMAERIDDFELETDPLVRRFQSMMRHGYTGLLDFGVP
jgi:hypothetical protein